MASKIEVHLVTPEREVFAGEADMVVARAVDGELGVLPGHVPMLVPLGIGVLAIVDESRRTQAAVDGGFLHVVSAGDLTRVDVLAEHAELAGEIDVTRANQRRDEAERSLSQARTDDALEEMEKANARLKATGNQG
jgi:F-type H+-transporting ATPase subunit epsilon